MAERLLLIDSNSLIYRGFFAIPPGTLKETAQNIKKALKTGLE